MLNKNKAGFHVQSWSQAVQQLSAQQIDYVLVTLLGTAGSTPRAHGSKMVVTLNDIYDTVGGGHLEFKIIQQARQQLAHTQTSQHIHHFPLGASLGQCCGGSVAVLFERIEHNLPLLQLYGAGHVAHALVSILEHLPMRIQWIDSREALFPSSVPANVEVIHEDVPEDALGLAQPESFFVIMTHNHQLDFSLTEKIIKKHQPAFLGVIGSKTKAERFDLRLQHKGFTESQRAQLVCPIGLTAITGKRPMEVAVSIAGQLIALYQQTTEKKMRQGVQWQQLKSDLKQTDLIISGD